MRNVYIGILIATLLAGCGGHESTLQQPAPGAWELVLADLGGHSDVDSRIARLQHELRANPGDAVRLERLGWAFVERARDASDPGAYALAERCADLLAEAAPDGAEALLLRGHVLHALHRFREAEAVAERLVAQRGLAFDHALLGDLRMERGRLDEAIDAYQRMADLRPDAAALSRIAHVRFLTGDFDGALEIMERAVRAASPRHRAAYAWTAARLAQYQLQAGDSEAALASADHALVVHATSPAALRVRGRVLLARGRTADAVESFAAAVRIEPLPEALWWLAEAQQQAGSDADAARTRLRLDATGETHDRRTMALYLATAGGDAERAVALARRELEERDDLYTHDALAWALIAADRADEATPHLERALAAGTPDARIFLHAGIAAAHRGDAATATRWLDRATRLETMLFPSERSALERARTTVGQLDG